MIAIEKNDLILQASLQALLQPSAIEIFEAVRSLFLQVRYKYNYYYKHSNSESNS